MAIQDNSGQEVVFTAIIRKSVKIRKNKKSEHWYITIPPSVQKILNWNKEKVVKVKLENPVK
jgi:hypothetical protein